MRAPDGGGAGSETVVGVVVAAGEASRVGEGIPKQFLEIGGRWMVERAVDCLASSPRVRGVVVVLAPSEIGGPRAARVEGLAGVHRVVAGGATRARSVRSGVRAAGARYVLVHDAARPNAGRALVEAVLEATLRRGAAVPAVPVSDTVREVEGGRTVRMLDRSRLRLAQTPQGARVDWLLDALERAERAGVEVTDEAAALERAGHAVAFVPGDPGNVKVTTREDLERARRRLEAGAAGVRVGTGFDIHRFGRDRRLVLGGVVFPGEPGLEGHSDADVVIHAVIDALLGAAGLGDIGTHFPPDDEAYRGASSVDLAGRAARRLAEAGFEVVNVDATVLAERPRIRDRVEAMRAAVAGCLAVDPSRVGIKATTLEGLGALGRAEGIACQAVAVVRRVREP